MSERCTVLLSSAGRRVALLEAFRHSLARMGVDGEVLAVDASRLSAAAQLADESFLVPHCTHDDFVPALLDICARHEVRLVVPTIDTELPVLSEHRRTFADVGTTVAISAPETIAIGFDKVHTHQWLVANSFPTVRQDSPVDVLAASAAWDFPLVVKPRRGSASIGVVTVRDPEELAVAARDRDVVVQSTAPGAEHTIDVFVDRDGLARCAVPRRRIEVRGGEVSKGVTVRAEALEVLGASLCERLPGAYGALNVQVFVDGDDLRVIEINARFGGGFPLAYAAGADFPGWLVEEALGRPSSAVASEWRGGVAMLRYDDHVIVDSATLGI